jgi:hypothetical protein
LLAIATALRGRARCCNNIVITLQALTSCRPAPQQRYELQRFRPSLQCSAAAHHRRSGD